MRKITLRLLLCVAGLLLLNAAGSRCQINVCGQAPLNNKIVGGQNAREGAWPWQVSIHLTRTGHFCGGSLINKEWVLSAAHCFKNIVKKDLKIYLGKHLQSGANAHETSRTVLSVVNHPKYVDSDNDIALLKLSSAVTFTNYIRPVCLASADSKFKKGTDTWITGWGTLSFGDIMPPNTLQEVSIPIVSDGDCKDVYGSSITKNMLCAGLKEGGKDSCQGDSGGPMVVNSTRWIQSGIVSFGFECARPKIPGVYTRVSRYESWINSHISSDPPGFMLYSSATLLMPALFSLTPLLYPLGLF